MCKVKVQLTSREVDRVGQAVPWNFHYVDKDKEFQQYSHLKVRVFGPTWRRKTKAPKSLLELLMNSECRIKR